VRRSRAETAILANRRNRRIVFRSHEADIVKFQRLQVNRFLDQEHVRLVIFDDKNIAPNAVDPLPGSDSTQIRPP